MLASEILWRGSVTLLSPLSLPGSYSSCYQGKGANYNLDLPVTPKTLPPSASAYGKAGFKTALLQTEVQTPKADTPSFTPPLTGLRPFACKTIKQNKIDFEWRHKVYIVYKFTLIVYPSKSHFLVFKRACKKLTMKRKEHRSQDGHLIFGFLNEKHPLQRSIFHAPIYRP